MLKIVVPASTMFDEKNEVFVSTKEQTLQLEHSLVSLTKWESKWKKPFLSKEAKTFAETSDYIKCMTTTQNVDPLVYLNLSNENIRDVNAYIEDTMTATIIKDDKQKPSREIITSELIYYWMIALTIPFECQKWHLNRLLTLIKVCSIKNSPEKKMTKKEIAQRNTDLNAARKAALKTEG